MSGCDTYLILLAFVLGTCFGSFAGVLALRLPVGKSIIVSRSSCPVCEKRIKPYDLVPVISFFLLKGKCRHCLAKISLMYPMVEFLCGLLFGTTMFLFDLPAVLPFAILAFALVVVALVDMHVKEIPDSMLVLMVAAAFFWIIFDPNSIRPLDAFIGAAAGALPLFLLDKITLFLIKKDGFGYGDVKLMGAAGLFLGWQGVLTMYFIAFISGAIAAAYMLRAKKTERGGYIAFGPFICLGTITAAWTNAFFGEHLTSFVILTQHLT